MSKHYQESEIEFRKVHEDTSDYPEARGVIVHQYGGSIEDCIKEARKQFNLPEDRWEVVSAEVASV